MGESFKKQNIVEQKQWKGLKYDMENILSDEMAEIAAHYLEEKILEYREYPNADKISLHEKLVLKEKVDLGIQGADTFPIEFEITGDKENFFELYKKNLAEKIPETNLRPGVLYTVTQWKPEFILLKGEEEQQSGSPSFINKS